MRKFTKLLVLVLSLALLAGSIFAVASFAAEDTGLTIEGATRTEIDFKDLVYDRHNKVNGDIAADPTTAVGTHPITEMVLSKYGHLRTVKSPVDGNTWFEWLFETDVHTSSAHDSVLCIESNLSLAGVGYYVMEFDMATRTDFPGNMQIMAEARAWNSGAEDKGYRYRKPLAQYNAASSEWVAGANTFALAPSEWVHVTVVTKVNPVYTTGEDGAQTVNYGTSVSKLYLNGEYINSVNFIPNYELPATADARIYYMGIGYCYGTQHTGTQIDDGIVLDNIVKTVIPASYAADAENDDLAALFAAENAETDVTDISEAIVWNSDYELPETELGVATYIPAEGEEYIAATIEDALQMLKDEENIGATIKLYANRYLPVHIDYPCVIELNGYALQNGYTCSSDLKVTAEGNTVTFEHDLENSATIKFYTVEYANIANVQPYKTQILAEGNAIDFSVLANAVPVIVDGKTGVAPTGVYKVYDEAGNEVTFDAVGADQKGKTYVVCPVLKTETLANDIAFYTSLNGAVTFYDTTDLWAAGIVPVQKSAETTTTDAEGVVTKTWTEVRDPKSLPDGIHIVLVKDAYVAPLLVQNGGTMTIDLAGHQITAPTELLMSSGTQETYTCTQVGDGAVTSTLASSVSKGWLKNGKVFIYSSAEGGVLFTGANLFNGSNSDGSTNNFEYYIGYKNADEVSEYRITVNFSAQILQLVKGAVRNIYFAKADLYNGKAHYNGLFGAQQSRGLDVYFTDCNIYTKTPLFGSNANSGAKTAHMVNTNVYAEDGVAMNWLYTVAAGDGSYVHGATVLNMTNSRIYGMTFGQTAGDGLADYTASFTINMDAKSFISDTHKNINTPDGMVLVTNPQSVVIGDVTYTTIYGVGTGTEETAKFNVYDVPFAELTGDKTPVYSWDIVAGGWFAHWATPAGETFYDKENDPYNTITPRGYEVYDEEGNLVTGPAVAGKTYSVCVKLEKVPVSFIVIDKDGNVTPYFEPSLYGVVFADGDTLVLLNDDVAISGAFTTEIYIDLNGKTLYVGGKINTFQPDTNVKQFVYSSKGGGKVVQGYTSAGSCGYLVNMNSGNSEFYFGYKDASTKSPYRIELYVGAFGELKKVENKVFLANTDVYKCFGDNYGFFNFRSPGYASTSYNAEDCNFYGAFGSFVTIRDITSDIGTVNLKNCNIYGSGQFVGYQKTNVGTKLTVNVENVAIYGSMAQGSMPAGIGFEINVSGYFYSCFEPTSVVLNGQMVKEEAHTVAFDGKMAPNAGFGNGEKLLYAGEYASAYAVVTDTFNVDAYKAQAFQNMTLDTNVVGNLYIPVDEAVASVMLYGQNILDKTAIRTIGGKDYYVLTFGVAPKYGNRSLTLTVNLERGVAVEFPMSVENYAKALFALDGTTNAYVADSQRMMKYVLTYIKEVAVAFGGADAATVFAGMDIAVDTNVALKEAVKDTTAINTYVTHAALDLDAYAGFAFKVAVGFVGTVRVEMAGVDAVEKTYTAEAPAGATEVVVLENVPAYLFRGDVTITVTPAEGEAVSAQFNLATYVNANADAAYVKALYAYTVEAEAYNAKYPTVNTVN